MIGIFTLKGSIFLPVLLVPLLGGTVIWSWYMHKSLKPLSKFVSLSSVFEVERGEESTDVMQLRAGHPVTWSQRCVCYFIRSTAYDMLTASKAT
jgi:calcium permeable stress-gated cation channel